MYFSTFCRTQNIRHLVSFEPKDISSKVCIHCPIQAIYTSTQGEIVSFSCEVPHVLLFEEIEMCQS